MWFCFVRGIAVMQTIANGTTSSDTVCSCNGDAGYRAVNKDRVSGQLLVTDCEQRRPTDELNGNLLQAHSHIRAGPGPQNCPGCSSSLLPLIQVNFLLSSFVVLMSLGIARFNWSELLATGLICKLSNEVKNMWKKMYIWRCNNLAIHISRWWNVGWERCL